MDLEQSASVLLSADPWEFRRGPEFVTLTCPGAGVEVSPDGLLVNNRSPTFQSVRTDVCITGGAWYYEVLATLSNHWVIYRFKVVRVLSRK